MANDPREDYEFTLVPDLLGEERVDPHEEEATIDVRIGTRINPDTIWRLARARLVLDLEDIPETIALAPPTEGPVTTFDLDVDVMNEKREVVVPLTVRTGRFAGAERAPRPGDYPIGARVEASYIGEIRGSSEAGTFNLTVAPD